MTTTYPNWFAVTAQSNFSINTITRLDNTQPLAVLQIGVFTGDGSKWIADNLLIHRNSFLDDVDTWGGSDEVQHEQMDFDDVERTYVTKLSNYLATGKVHQHKMTSQQYFATCDKMYDLIYIDGNHTALAVLNDAIDADRHLKVGGLLAFDDYTWTANKDRLDDPKPAIDVFEDIYGPYYEVVTRNSQVWMVKKAWATY